MRISVPIAIAALFTLIACKSDDDDSGPGGLCDEADAPENCCMVDSDCERTCPAGDRCLCAIRHEQAGHCYSDCPLERPKVMNDVRCVDYFAGTGCAYGPDGKLDTSKVGCGYYCTSEGWVVNDCDYAAKCAKTGGTESTALCCYSTTDFPNAEIERSYCACEHDTGTIKVKVCHCPQGMGFSRWNGCEANP